MEFLNKSIQKMLVSLVGGGSFGFGVVSALTPTLLQGLSAGAALSLNVSTMVLGAVLLIGLLCHLIGWMNQLRHVFYATAFVAGAGLVGFALASYVTPAMVQGIIPGLPTTAALGIGFGLMMLGGLAMLLVCRTVVKKITFKHIAKLGLFCVGGGMLAFGVASYLTPALLLELVPTLSASSALAINAVAMGVGGLLVLIMVGHALQSSVQLCCVKQGKSSHLDSGGQGDGGPVTAMRSEGLRKGKEKTAGRDGVLQSSVPA